MGMGEKFLEDQELEQLLEERETANDEKKDAAKEFREIDERCKELIGRLAPDMAIGEKRRCGRFVISKSETEEKDVSLTRGGNVRLSIALSADSRGDG
jgi:hypothetical protein